jgi:NADH:ubiquinone oxidoreductase subunit 5 (subunit L)/multisubunit Na+/H+ antiporter MnhA subunit
MKPIPAAEITEIDPTVQAQLLDWVQETAAAGQDFISREAPLYAAEVVSWYFWSSIFLMLVMLSVAVMAFIIYRYAARWFTTAETHDEKELAATASLVSLGLMLVFLGFSAHQGYGAVKAAVAPRMVVIEHLRGLVDQNGR